MKWTEGRFKNHTASLGNGLTLHVQYSDDIEAVRRDLCWDVIVFGKNLEPHRTVESAKNFAESVARLIIRSAAEECGLRVLEEKE